MDQVDIDHIVDVPDTPDRLARHGINGNDAVENENHSPLTHCYSRQQNIFKDGSKDQPMIVDSGSRGLSMWPQVTSRRSINSTASSFSSSSSSRNAHLFREGVTEKNPSYPSHDSIHNRHPRSVRPSCISKSSCRKDSFVDLTGSNMHRPVIGNVSGIGSSNYFQEGVGFLCNNIQEKPGSGGFLSLGPIASPRVNKHKRLVRNRCISPNNIAKAKQLAGKEDSNGSVAVERNNNGSKPCSAPPIPISLRELVADDGDSYTRKGKGVITQPCPSNEPDSRNRNLQSSSSIKFNEFAIAPNEYNLCADKSIEESGGWRSTRHRNTETNISSPDEELNVMRGRPSSRYSSQHYENMFGQSENGISVENGDGKGLKLNSSERVDLQPLKESVSHRSTRLGRLNGNQSTANTLIKRQKQGSTSSTYGQCSAPVSDDPKVVSLCSPTEAVDSASTSRNVNNIESDEFSPHLRRDAHDEDARARQVEADELLARALQEELYNEMPVFSAGEVDEHMAMALQNQDDPNHGFHRVGHPIFDARASTSNLRRQSQSRSSSSAPRRGSLARSAASGRMTRLSRRFPGQSRSLLSSRGRASLFPEDMDVDMRMHILGALEEYDDMELSSGILQFPLDFNENDYEMLLSLDDNNDQHSGASVRQINGLPQSIVQTENFEETCAVCLETPTIGETIRHLPCLHKFHKDCIDPWLRRRTSCPVCKSSVT